MARSRPPTRRREDREGGDPRLPVVSERRRAPGGAAPSRDNDDEPEAHLHLTVSASRILPFPLVTEPASVTTRCSLNERDVDAQLVRSP